MIAALAVVGAVTLAALLVGFVARTEEVGVPAGRLFLVALFIEAILSVLVCAGVG